MTRASSCVQVHTDELVRKSTNGVCAKPNVHLRFLLSSQSSYTRCRGTRCPSRPGCSTRRARRRCSSWSSQSSK